MQRWFAASDGHEKGCHWVAETEARNWGICYTSHGRLLSSRERNSLPLSQTSFRCAKLPAYQGRDSLPLSGTLAFSARPLDADCGNFRHRGGAAQGDFWAHRPTGALPNPCPGWLFCCVASPWKTMARFSARLDLNETSCTRASRVGGCTLSFLWLIGKKVQYCVCGLYPISRVSFHIINTYSRQWCIGADSCLITRAQLCISLQLRFSDFTQVSWNHTWREHLHHAKNKSENQGFFFFP